MAAVQPSLVAGLRRFVRPPPPPGPPTGDGDGGHCELCPISLADDHKHLLDLDERRIVCVCPTCWSMRSGDARYRPTGSRTLWLEGFALPDDLWAAFQIPIGLAFFMRSSESGRVVGLYPSPAGATECELDLEAWDRLAVSYPLLAGLAPDTEAIFVHQDEIFLIPIDMCYSLVGELRLYWQGFDGGAEARAALETFLAGLRQRAVALTPAVREGEH